MLVSPIIVSVSGCAIFSNSQHTVHPSLNCLITNNKPIILLPSNNFITANIMIVWFIFVFFNCINKWFTFYHTSLQLSDLFRPYNNYCFAESPLFISNCSHFLPLSATVYLKHLPAITLLCLSTSKDLAFGFMFVTKKAVI